MSIQTICYNSWEDFKSSFVHDVYGSDEPVIGSRLFRGQRSDSWKLMTSFERWYGSLANKWDFETKTVELFKDKLIRSKLVVGAKKLSDNEVRAIAQHYGLPTNLLDWSYSPYIAAFFAFDNPASEEVNCVTIFVLDPKCSLWKNQGCEIIYDYNPENIHQMKQEGVFTLLKHTKNTLEDFVDTSSCVDKDNALIRILIPKTERLKAVKDLRLMHIDHSSIYSGIESLARASIIEAQMIFNIE